MRMFSAQDQDIYSIIPIYIKLNLLEIMTRRFTNFKECLPCNLPLYNIAITDDSALTRVYSDRPSRIYEYLNKKLNLQNLIYEILISKQCTLLVTLHYIWDDTLLHPVTR